MTYLLFFLLFIPYNIYCMIRPIKSEIITLTHDDQEFTPLLLGYLKVNIFDKKIVIFNKNENNLSLEPSSFGYIEDINVPLCNDGSRHESEFLFKKILIKRAIHFCKENGCVEIYIDLDPQNLEMKQKLQQYSFSLTGKITLCQETKSIISAQMMKKLID